MLDPPKGEGLTPLPASSAVSLSAVSGSSASGPVPVVSEGGKALAAAAASATRNWYSAMRCPVAKKPLSESAQPRRSTSLIGSTDGGRLRVCTLPLGASTTPPCGCTNSDQLRATGKGSARYANGASVACGGKRGTGSLSFMYRRTVNCCKSSDNDLSPGRGAPNEHTWRSDTTPAFVSTPARAHAAAPP